MPKYSASYRKDLGKHLATVVTENGKRTFRLYSSRSAKAFVMLVENYPGGITTKNMRDTHGIDDNKLFGELLDQSGFREYMKNDGTRNRLKVWKIELPELISNTSSLKEPIWLGTHEQTSLAAFKESLLEIYPMRCNMLGINLYESSSKKFMSNLRKIAIDHRRPMKYSGKNELDNLQLLSYYANERKNQICVKCKSNECEICALAYPEQHSIVMATNEDISDLLSWRNQIKK